MSAAAQRPRDAADRAAALIAACSIEVSPRDALAGDGLLGLLAHGRTVFVNHAPSVTCDDIVAACARLRRAGFIPVPHVAARRLASFTQAGDFLRRANDEAGVDSILLIGGDNAPAGPFHSSLDLLATGLVESHGVRHVAFAGYPEGHPTIDTRRLQAALQAKVALAEHRGLDVSLVTQFGFESAPIRRWIAGQRALGITCPVSVGVAGPANVSTLATFAVRCGIGASLRALARGHTAFARILTEAGPDALIEELVADVAVDPPVDSIHVFTFGGVRRTAEWIRAATSTDAA